MRFLTIAGAATLLLLPAAVPASACGGAGRHSAQTISTDYSAAKKKPAMVKPSKKKKEKVEYMRAVPMK